MNILKKRKGKDMTKEEMKKMNLTPIEELIAEDFGAQGTAERMEFDAECDAFILGERLKEERLKVGLTQEQLAKKIGTKKSYISRVENGHTDLQVSTLFKIFQGLGRRVSLRVL
jgi:ribosome-binding protein aMBF1 (putative translation factor)